MPIGIGLISSHPGPVGIGPGQNMIVLELEEVGGKELEKLVVEELREGVCIREGRDNPWSLGILPPVIRIRPRGIP
jgi:hypothetical protein